VCKCFQPCLLLGSLLLLLLLQVLQLLRQRCQCRCAGRLMRCCLLLHTMKELRQQQHLRCCVVVRLRHADKVGGVAADSPSMCVC
jgi:hypothetical protein